MLRFAQLPALTLVASLAVVSCGVNDAATLESASQDATGSDERAMPADPEAIRPFEISVPQSVLDDLQERLARTRFPDEIEGAGWDYGANLAYMEEFVQYWHDEFDWREQERRLNEFDQFKTNIDGLDIHFIHQRSPVADAMPLIITHGWPGSIVEFIKIIEPLTNPEAYGGDASQAFHVIAPSIPGFGFSDKPSERGYNPARMAQIFATLMERLGYERYGAQGGDYGSGIMRQLAIQQPERVLGLHINFVTAGPPPGDADPEAGVTAEELERVRERAEYSANERGYSAIQRTKPQTIGMALHDSPVGQAAWIVDKIRWLCDRGADPVCTTITRDEMLTDITVYWVTGTAASSARLYYESRVTPAGPPAPYIEVPVGAALFPKEITLPPRAWAEARYNIARWTEMPRGGHFAALEEPELLVEDVRAFFGDLR
jgi:pimeloyl-ACP methyl ester carboxylesterase